MDSQELSGNRAEWRRALNRLPSKHCSRHMLVSVLRLPKKQFCPSTRTGSNGNCLQQSWRLNRAITVGQSPPLPFLARCGLERDRSTSQVVPVDKAVSPRKHAVPIPCYLGFDSVACAAHKRSAHQSIRQQSGSNQRGCVSSCDRGFSFCSAPSQQYTVGNMEIHSRFHRRLYEAMTFPLGSRNFGSFHAACPQVGSTCSIASRGLGLAGQDHHTEQVRRPPKQRLRPGSQALQRTPSAALPGAELLRAAAHRSRRPNQRPAVGRPHGVEKNPRAPGPALALAVWKPRPRTPG